MGFLLSFGIISELLECSFFPVRRFLIIHFPLFILQLFPALYAQKDTLQAVCLFVLLIQYAQSFSTNSGTVQQKVRQIPLPEFW